MFQGTPATRKPNFLFLGILIVLNLPNFLWLSPQGVALVNGADFIELLLPCLLQGACFLALFRRPWCAWLTLWLLCIWWQPLAIGVRAINGTVINANLVGMALATSPAELRDLVSIIPVGWFIYFAIWNLICAGFFYVLLQNRLGQWSWSFRGKIIFFCACMLALPYVVLPQMQQPDNSWSTLSKSGSSPLEEFAKADQNSGLAAHFPEAFPFELPRAIAQYWQARRIVDSVRANLRAPDLDSTLGGALPQAEVVVLVIGESSTRNAWHWFNPEAPATTPHLESRIARGESLWGFRHTLAQTVSTRQAVPSMLTAQPLVWPSGQANPDATRSIVSVATQAGYATAWFSNQAAVGKHDGIIASYAQEADATAFLNPSGFADQGSLDAVLLPALRRHLTNNPMAFVVLHTLGSHFNYAHRYPRGFGPYPQAENEREAYFNSVAYTDWLLDQVMDILARDGRRAVMIYASDHGETISGGVCNAETARRSTRDAYEIPALVWLSNSYVTSYPGMAEKLHKHQDAPYTVAAVHQTMLDLMRGNTQAPSKFDVQSFVRWVPLMDGEGHEISPAWTKKFEAAVNINPCYVHLQ